MNSLPAMEFAVLALGLSESSRTALMAATVPEESAPAPRTVEDLRAVMSRHRGDFEG